MMARFFEASERSSVYGRFMAKVPVVAVTMGDPAGIGPEVVVKALCSEAVRTSCTVLIVGDRTRLEQAANASGLTHVLDDVDVVQEGLLPPGLPFGEVSSEAGAAAYAYVASAVRLTLNGGADAICTAPLNKASLNLAGYRFPGHTELLAELSGVDEVSMLLVAPGLRVIHVTTHVGLIDAVERIDAGKVYRTIKRGHAVLGWYGSERRRIGVCGINPHAGEDGLFGRGEEAAKIAPAIVRARSEGINVEGPLPGDTLFYRAKRGDFDLVVAMFHDQGHGPVKVLGLEWGVNITVGLPFVRTSVDHGTAFDIAGQGLADERSMVEALLAAARLAETARRDAHTG